MPTFFFNALQLWRTACEARDRVTAKIAQNPDAFQDDTTVAIILSAASAEGFINEIAELCHPDFTGAKYKSVPRQVSAFAEAVREIEKSRGTTLFKYLMASYVLSGTMFDKGTNPYQDLALLFDLRDMHMHLRLIDQEGPEENGIDTTVLPRKIQTLCTRGLARPVTKDLGFSWFNAIQTEPMARWACQTSLNMMIAPVDMIPDNIIIGIRGIKELLKQQDKRRQGGTGDRS